MRIALRLLPLLLVILGVVATPATAVPELTSKTKAFDVRISGSHVVDWAYASALDRQSCSSWSVGKGRFEANYRIAKKVRFELTEIRRNGRLIETQWGTAHERLPKFTIKQEGEWKDNNGFRMECTPCGPLSEYGPCVPDPPARPKPSCPSKRSTVGVIDMTFFGKAGDVPNADELVAPLRPGPVLRTEVRYSEDPKQASRCYPQAGGEALPLPQPSALHLAMARLVRMERGERHGFRAGLEEYLKSGALTNDDCGPIEGALKMNACGTTRIELKVKRVR